MLSFHLAAEADRINGSKSVPPKEPLFYRKFEGMSLLLMRQTQCSLGGKFLQATVNRLHKNMFSGPAPKQITVLNETLEKR